MKQSFLSLGLAVSLGICPIVNKAQISGSDRAQKPLLRVNIVLTKETYGPNEDITTTTSFVNLSDKTLCFPRPAQEQMNFVRGYLTTKVIGPAGAEQTKKFVDVVVSKVTWPQDKLLQEIKENWVKLLPGSEYKTESVQLREKFDRLGEWRLQRTYSPPEWSARYRELIQSAAETEGCRVPDAEVSTETVTITIVLSSRAAELTDALAALRSNPNDNAAQERYLKAFPHQYKEFVDLFDLHRELYDGHDFIFPLSSLGKEHEAELGKLLVGLAKDAHYEADALSYLQHVTAAYGGQHPETFAKLLKQLPWRKQNQLIIYLADVENHSAYHEYQEIIDHLNRIGERRLAARFEEARTKRERQPHG